MCGAGKERTPSARLRLLGDSGGRKRCPMVQPTTHRDAMTVYCRGGRVSEGPASCALMTLIIIIMLLVANLANTK